jgi:hypothetical protein
MKNRSVVSRLGTLPRERERPERTTQRDDPEPQAVGGEYAFATLIIKTVYLVMYLIAERCVFLATAAGRWHCCDRLEDIALQRPVSLLIS